MTSISNAVALVIANAAADGVDTGGAGSIVVYGTPLAANVEEAISTQPTIVTVPLHEPGYEDAAMVGSDAVAALTTTPTLPSAVIGATETASFARIRDGNGLVRRQINFGGEITIADPNLILGDTLELQ